jgi:hypothetical protein
MMKTRKLVAHAAIIAAGFLATPLVMALCPQGSAKPFTSGPLDALGMFSTYVVDGNGIGLQACTTSVTNDGLPPPCFYDPVVPGNDLSRALGRGNEAFMFLADSVFTTTGAFPIDVVIVQGVEAAFLSPTPTAGFQTQFQRLRTRVNVAAVGNYLVETPWGSQNYVVDTLLPPGNGQNRSEISDPVDITFAANSTVPGLVSPFLVASPEIVGFGKAEGYIGDGLTLTTVTGSPCGQNFVRITATGLDGATPIDINNGSNVVTSTLFTTMGKIAPTAAVPLAITAAYYTRTAGASTVTVMSEGSTSATEIATTTVNAPTAVRMAHDGQRFYATVPAVGEPPLTISVTASDAGRPSTPNTKPANVTDLVSIDSAVATCNGAGLLRSCLLTVTASSTDDGTGPVGTQPTLTLVHTGTAFAPGVVTAVSAALPAAVSVKSSNGGLASKPVTVINQ